MNARRILCPIDFSEHSDVALGYASALAQESGAVLYLVHVDDSQLPYDAGYSAFVPPAINPQALEEKLAEVRPAVAGVTYQHQVLFGNPADMLVSFAREQNIDLIVMGTHGRTGVARLLMGSVAEAVMRRAPCPVLTVKNPVAESASAAGP